MTHPATTRRFRVALSFPGNCRPRVEKIAEKLASHLGRERVLYDRWYAAEFARPNLDTYLEFVYLRESDLIAVFHCREYAEKEWCGLEWRACRDLLKKKEDARLMIFRLDDADIPGVYSIDGYLDIRAIADDEVAAAILSRLGEIPRKAFPAFTSKFPIVNPILIGREQQIEFLERAWADPGTHLVQIIAAGGTGKTALVDKWFRRHLGEARIFCWSFFSQGVSSDGQPSSEPFFTDIIRWLRIDVETTDSIYIKAEAIARRLREERVLLLLDGVEPLQGQDGFVRDAALRALLQELATGHRGLAVCTTRVRMDIAEAVPLDLNNLTPEQGAEYLRSLKVQGTEEELRKASQDYGNHALALTLLGTFLADFHDHDVYHRFQIRDLLSEEGKQYEHARRMVEAYQLMFCNSEVSTENAAAAVLRALGYFDRPAEPEALKLVLPAMEERKFRAALRRLHDARLVLSPDPAQPLDCHPIIREHFAEKATREGHWRLYEHYCKQAPHRPVTLEEMTPLFYAVYHGCQAGQHQVALEEVYLDRIRRGDEFYLVYQFGAFGIDLSLISNFFETPWTKPVTALSPMQQLEVIGQAGFALRALGRLADAVAPLKTAAEEYVRLKDWKNAAIRYGNISVLKLVLGNVAEANHAARQAVAFADKSEDRSARVKSRSIRGEALHQSGDLPGAMRLFKEAERLQRKSQSACPILNAVDGYRYCDLLLAQGLTDDVLSRASKTLGWAEEQRVLLDIGLNHLLLGRAHVPGSAEAAHHFDRAIDFLRRAGSLHRLPLGLLARGTEQDLAEVLRVATRAGMRLYLADYHLARSNFAEAERLISETGYHRRDSDLEKLRTQRPRGSDGAVQQ